MPLAREFHDPDVRSAMSGDDMAFGRLYRRHRARVAEACYRIARDPDHAEDFTQQTFIRAWSRLHQFRGTSTFGTWLYRLALNVAYNGVRSEARHHRSRVYPPDVPTLDVLIGGDSRGVTVDPIDLDAAVGALPLRSRQVIALCARGLRHDEIAARLGITPGTCRAQLHRARRHLRESLDL